MRFFVSLQTIVPQRPPAWQEIDGKGTGVYPDLNNCHASYLKLILGAFLCHPRPFQKKPALMGNNPSWTRPLASLTSHSCKKKYENYFYFLSFFLQLCQKQIS